MRSGGAEDGDEGRRLRTDQVGLDRISAAVDLLERDRRMVVWEVVEGVMERRRARRQDVQSAIVGCLRRRRRCE